MKSKFSCLRKLPNQYKGKVLEGIGKLLPRNHVSMAIVITKHRQKGSSLITEVLPNSPMVILQDLFRRLLLQEKWSVTSACWLLSHLLGCISPSQCLYMTYLSACAPRGAVIYQPCQKNIYGSWLVWCIFNLSSFTYLSHHLMFHHQRICMLCICIALGTHNFNLTKKVSADALSYNVGTGAML